MFASSEFGKVGIDEEVLASETIKEKVDKETIEVLNGCVCCAVRGDLVVVTLKRLYKKVFKSDPAPVAQKHLIMRLDDEKPEDVENEAQQQLAFADVVLLNKIDLVPEEPELQLYPMEDLEACASQKNIKNIVICLCLIDVHVYAVAFCLIFNIFIYFFSSPNGTSIQTFDGSGRLAPVCVTNYSVTL